MKKLISYAFEYEDGHLEVHTEVKGWENPREAKDVQGVYHVGPPDYHFWKDAMHMLGPSEHYCVFPVDEERFDQLKLEAMLYG